MVRKIAEESLLGAIFLKDNAMDMVTDLVSEDDFTTDFRKKIWSAMVELHKEVEPIDPVTVLNEMEKSGYEVDEEDYEKLRDIISAPFSSSHVLEYAKIVGKK